MPLDGSHYHPFMKLPTGATRYGFLMQRESEAVDGSPYLVLYDYDTATERDEHMALYVDSATIIRPVTLTIEGLARKEPHNDE